MSRPSLTPRFSLVIPWKGAPPPLDALAALANRPHVFLRHAAGGPAGLGRWSFLASDPVEVLELRGGAGRAPGGASDPWARLGRGWPRAVRRLGPRIPFAGGWAGTLGYELRSAVEDVPPPRTPEDGFPVLWLGRYDAVAVWDARTGRAYLAGTGETEVAARRAIRAFQARLAARAAPPERNRRPTSQAPEIRAECEPTEYRRKVAEIRRRIRAGDLFQANLSQRFDTAVAASPIPLFSRLCNVARAPFMTYLDLGRGRRILSASPERFLRLAGTLAETRPMKGTRPRGATRGEDQVLRRALEESVKDRAELAMIVDLSRNDLGRVCRPGTVRVRVARRLERYSTVHQAVGVVTGRLERGRTGVDLIRAAFPPGSVTGAPKVEALRVIDRLEGEARGPYCGALGWLDEGGDMDLSVAIRTISLAGRRASFRVGGGITLLSDPTEEYVETLDKSRAIREALGASTRGAP